MITVKPCSGCGNYPTFCTCGGDVPQVYAPCISAFFNQHEAKLINISEGPQGEDIATYTCPHCHGIHDSRVVRHG